MLSHLSCGVNGLLLSSVLSCLVLASRGTLQAGSFPRAARIAEIARWLPEKPQGLGAPIHDRAAWERVSRRPAFRDIVAEAERRLAEPAPELTDELYLEYSRNGNRRDYEDADSALRHRLRFAVLAECVEDQGRFLPEIEAMIRRICSLRSWTLPAHDQSLACFQGKTQTINLRTAGKAWNLASCHWLLGNRLPDETRTLIHENVCRRVLDPVRGMYEGKRTYASWIASTGNHNAVCHARVTGAALALLDRREDRALYVAGSEHYICRYLQGFESDGYCSEGLTYWNYGFGRFLALAETVHQATQGKLDLLKSPGVRQAAWFGWNTQLTEKLSPAFADCDVDVKPDGRMLWYLRRRMALSVGPTEFDPARANFTLPDSLMYSFLNPAATTEGTSVPATLPARSWFRTGQMLVARPGPQSGCRLTVAMKGGHNAEKHNHNDVGTYVVAMEDVLLLVDPGREVYSRRTFGRDRYESAAHNALGHSVPVVAGKPQRWGREARARILETVFHQEADVLKMDIAAAYDVRELETLTRTFTYDRHRSGSLRVRDEVRFRWPRPFETAFITFGRIMRISDDALRVTQDGKSVRIIITTNGPMVKVTQSTLEGDFSAGKPPTRVGVHLAKPVTEATIDMIVEPM